MSIRHELRNLLWGIGFDFSRFTPLSHPLARRKQILDSYEIDTVLDIGANLGQFAQLIRVDIGYANRIISFEPLSSAFELLKSNAERNSNWDVFIIALGNIEEKCRLNIAGNSFSSSLLEMLPAHVESAPESQYIGKEVVEVKRLVF